MAYTPEQIGELIAGIALLPQSTRDLLNNKSTPETLEAFGLIISGQRSQGMNDAVSAVVSGSVTSWPTLQGAAQLADGAATIAGLQAFKAALNAGADANALLAAAVTACFSACKLNGI